MIEKIKNSIAAKTFLSICSLLLICCVIIYVVISYSLPETYRLNLTSKFYSDYDNILEYLKLNSVDDAEDVLIEFANTHSASLDITTSDQKRIMAINYSNEIDQMNDIDMINISDDFKYQGIMYTFTVTTYLVSVNQVENILIQILPFVLIVVILISLLGAFIFSKYYTTRLIQISEVSKKISNLDMRWECETKSNDEIGVLAQSLNFMRNKLQQVISQLKGTNEELQNEIEKSKKLEQQRYDFFTAVSHELKTPITIMKGELEGMIQNIGEYQDRERYLRNVYKTNIRMEKLVQEILSTSKLGNFDFQLQIVCIDISSFLYTTTLPLFGIAEDKNIEIIFETFTNFTYEGDKELLEKAFTNIIHNAIRYSPENSKVYIRIKEGKIFIKNTNIEIIDSNLDNLFSPFYRDDKSRNRNSGGSGLGLYIVKTIFDRHNIDYKLANDKGSVIFSVSFYN